MTGRPESLSAVTIGCTDLAASHAFYTALGFDDVAHGTPADGFISYRVGRGFLNLQGVDSVETGWGRFIVHVDDVDAVHQRALDAGLHPSMAPSDATWGERYFHIDDPDGHEVSFARPLCSRAVRSTCESAPVTRTRDAYRHLLDTLDELGDRFAGEEWGIVAADDVAESHRFLLHLLASGLETQLDDDPAHPAFRPIVTPWRKVLGDNADARYHDARVHPDGVYRVRGNTGGAVYVSFTVESGPADGSFPDSTDGVLNDTGFAVADDGSFEFTVGGPDGDLALGPRASRITVRHYWEQPDTPGRPPEADLALTIDLVDGDVPSLPRAPTDDSVADAVERMATYLRSRTVDTIPIPGTGEPPAFVSTTPNVFPDPVPPGDHALAAADASYSMAPFVLGPDEALVIEAAWPECRCANVNLWNRQMQTLDYLRHPISLNRASTADVADDGTFTVVVAHQDPGRPNWLDTEGRPFGLVFWRYLLPEGPIATPQARVVSFTAL